MNSPYRTPDPPPGDEAQTLFAQLFDVAEQAHRDLFNSTVGGAARIVLRVVAVVVAPKLRALERRIERLERRQEHAG